MTKYSKLNNIKLNNLSPNALFQPVLHKLPLIHRPHLRHKDCVAAFCHFMLVGLRYLGFFHNTALRLKEIVAMHSIMLPMKSISQKVVSAMRV